MKKRIGFVSNSSSSSFILVFDKKPESEKDLKKILFGDQEKTIDWYDNSISTDIISKIVFKDLIDKNHFSDIISNFYSVVNSLAWNNRQNDYPEYIYRIKETDEYKEYLKYHMSSENWKSFKELSQDEQNHNFSEQNRLTILLGKMLYDIFIENVDGKYLYHVEYSDNDGSTFATIDHGNVFKNIEHIRISKH